MLRPVPMVRFRAQVPNRDAAAATRAIASEGLLHLVDVAHGRAPYDASPPGVRELYAAFRDLLQRARSVADRLGIAAEELNGSLGDESVDFAVERDRLHAELDPIEKRLQALTKARSAAAERVATARDAVANADRIRAAGIDVDRIASLRFATIRFGIASPDALPSVSAVLSPVSHVVVQLAPDFFAAAVPASARERLDEAFRLAAAQTVALPSGEQPDLAGAERDEADAKNAIDDERAKLAGIVREIVRRAEVGALLLQAQTYFAAAGRFIVISGWVPEASAQRLKQRVLAATQNRAVVDIEPVANVAASGEALRVPILHRNPLLLRPFQKLVDMYGTPSYAEVEPTAFFAIAFLAMFGLMFGDVGHGAVLFAAGWLLFRHLPRFLDYGLLLMEAGVSSAIFGVLYGSLFGIRNLLPALWLEPLDDLPRFMMIAVVFGVVVVTAGLLLNIINSWRSGNLREALTGPKGVAGALLYWVILVLLVRTFLPAKVRVPGAVILALVVAVVVIVAATPFIVRAFGREAPVVRAHSRGLRALEASIELVDTLFSFFANTISFVRIAAFAAVHCGVFIAVFALAETMAALPLGGLWSIVVHVAGNAVVILLEGLTVSVQVLRLEYYEFFGKFFRGGGEAYAPLSVTRRIGHV